MTAGAPSVAVEIAASVEAIYMREVSWCPVSMPGRVSEKWRVRTHGWMDQGRFGEREKWPDDLYMFVQASEMDPGAGEVAALVTIMLLSCLPRVTIHHNEEPRSDHIELQ